MSIKTKVLEQCENAKEAALNLVSLDTEAKNFVLFDIIQSIVR